MKRLPVIAAAAAVIALGLAVAIHRSGADDATVAETEGTVTASDLAAKRAIRGESATPGEIAGLPRTGRRETPATPLGAAGAEAERRLQEHLTPDQRKALAAARAGHTPTPADRAAGEQLAARHQATVAMQEKLADAVRNEPENWQQTYRDLEGEYLAAHNPDRLGAIGGGYGGGITNPGDGGTDTPTDPGTGNGNNDGIDLAEAERLLPYYEESMRNSAPVRPNRPFKGDPRFSRPELTPQR
jgi:hypothetical protein